MRQCNRIENGLLQYHVKWYFFFHQKGVLVKSFNKHIQGYWGVLLLSMMFILLATGFTLLFPLLIRYAVDTVIGGEKYTGPLYFDHFMPNLGAVLIAIVVTATFRALFTFLRGAMVSSGSEHVAERLRNNLYTHIQWMSFATHSSNQTGDMIQRCTSDVDTFIKFIRIQISEVARLLAMVVVSAMIMLTMSVKLTIIPIVVAVILLISSYFFHKIIRKKFLAADEMEGKMTNITQESLSGVRVVKAFGMEQYEYDMFDDINRVYRDRITSLLKTMGLFFASSDFLSIANMGVVIVFGAALVMKGEITIGTFIAFSSYAQYLNWPIKQLGRLISDFGKASVAVDRINEILDTPIEAPEIDKLMPPIQGRIEFQDVSFSYNEEEPVLDHVSFVVEAGETLGIVGSTGSGKSSLVLLLQKLYDYEGRILIDGVELREISKEYVRSSIGLILQEPYLYSKIIKDNIGIVRKDFTWEQIEKSAKMADIHDNIVSLKDGYDTIVGEKGVSLSGGQRQRIAIARTVIDDQKKILIFDDSLSAVDAETDANIRSSLRSRGKGITTLIISHRMNTIASSDKILVIEDGKISAFGTHEMLLKQEGLYKRLYELQTKEVV